jgi:hypothetical protein
MFDHSLVDKCRKKFKADDAFPEVHKTMFLRRFVIIV